MLVRGIRAGEGVQVGEIVTAPAPAPAPAYQRTTQRD